MADTLRNIGEQMANVMFNLAQRPGEPLTGDVVATMDSLRKQWDAALASRPAEVDDQQPAPATTCTHSLTITRIGEGGAWCCHCGAKAFEVEFRECRGCEFYRRLSGLSMCKRYTMAVSPTMHATYRVSDGTCFVPAIGGGLTVGAQ